MNRVGLPSLSSTVEHAPIQAWPGLSAPSRFGGWLAIVGYHGRHPGRLLIAVAAALLAAGGLGTHWRSYRCYPT